MRRPAWYLLLHPVFLFSLIILVLNDHWWKYSFPGWLTGKLSDFAGVLVVTIFLFVLMPGKRVLAACISALAFVWWKSQLSEALIYWINTYAHLTIKRVIDYSDDLALLVVPVAFYVKPLNYTLSLSLMKFLKPVLLSSTVIAICATSMPRMNDYHYPEGYVSILKDYKTRLSKGEVLRKLDSMQINYRYDSVEMLPVNSRNYFLRIDANTDAAPDWRELYALKDTALYYKRIEYPYYIIPTLVIEGDTISNIKFRYFSGKRLNTIELLSIEIPPSKIDYRTFDQMHKKYKKLLKSVIVDL